MMIIVKDSVGLPGLPPEGLEIHSRMVNYSVIIRVDGHHVEHHCVVGAEDHEEEDKEKENRGKGELIRNGNYMQKRFLKGLKGRRTGCSLPSLVTVVV